MRSRRTACDSSQNATQSCETIGSLIAAIACGSASTSSSRADPDLVVVGLELARDEVGELELVALAPARVGEADRERGQAALALLGEQRDDQARVEPAGEQHADRDVGDHPPPDRDAQRLEQRVPPVLRRAVRARALERRVPVGALAARAPSGSTTSIVAGGSLRTPRRIVRGAGTTECQLR